MELLRRLEAQARAALPESTYGYFAGGAGDERTISENEEAWRRLWLVPEQLTGVGTADTAVELLGAPVAAPIVLAPTAAQRLLHPDGELAVARAAASAGLISCLSTRATADLGEVAAAAPGAPRWFQLYFHPDRAIVARQLARAAEHGYSHVVVTVDMPVAGRRERERDHDLIAFPEGVTLTQHLGADTELDTKPVVGGWATLTWRDLTWVAQESGLPVLAKGVLTARDAEQAVEAGAAGVVVSNHGGRQIDGCIPTAAALPDVVAAAGGRVPVLVDGGIRDGGDIVRALALGAEGVLIGRPYLWGLATGGESGVGEVLTAFTEDLARTLVLVGAASPGAVTAQHIRARPW